MAAGDGMSEYNWETGKWFDAGNPDDPNNPKNKPAPEPAPPPAPPEAHHQPTSHHKPSSGGGGGGGGGTAYTAQLIAMINELEKSIQARQMEAQKQADLNIGGLTAASRLSNALGARRTSARRTYLTPAAGPA